MTLACTDVTKSFGAITAVDDVSAEFSPGTIYGLIGPNGAGKTTFFDVLSGFRSPDVGRISLEGDDITGWSPNKRAKHGLCRTFQGGSLFPGLTVEENLYVSYNSTVREQLRSEPPEHARELADELLELLDMADKSHLLASELSGGQQKLTEFGTLVMTDPDYVLFDEPVSGVNPTLINDIKDFIYEMTEDAGITPIIVEHNMEFVMDVCEEIRVLDQGRIIKRGPPEEIQQDEDVIDAYLGGS